MKITAVIIAKNEEEIVEHALQSVQGFDEIIFVDTGSTDRTLEIAKKYTDKIFHFEWCDDFAAARNFAIEQATGDWIYSIDCDHVLSSSAEEVRAEAIRADEAGEKVAMVLSDSGQDHKHWREVFFKNTPEVRWVGKIHECLNVRTEYKSTIVRLIGYSKNHYSDKDRNIRILLQEDQTKPRTKFYLGREYYERRRFDEAILSMEAYLKITGGWIPEVAEAWLVIARSHWFSQRGSEARKACGMAIQTNPMFKEALLFMATIHNEPWKSGWKKLAEVADNTNVLFVRAK